MAQWTKVDEADGSPIWSPSQFKEAPTRAEANTLYGNTTADAYFSGTTIGTYGVNDTEVNQLVYHVLGASLADPGDYAYVVTDVLTVANSLAGDGNTHVEANLTVLTVEVGTATANDAGDDYTNGDILTITANGTFSVAPTFLVETGAADNTVASLTIVEKGVCTVEPSLSQVLLENLTVANSAANGASVDLEMQIRDLEVTVPGVYTAQVNATGNPVTGGTGSSGEIALTLSGGESDGKIAGGTGWVARTVGTGGRAGRVQCELLVAVGSMEGDTDGDDTVFPEFPDES